MTKSLISTLLLALAAGIAAARAAGDEPTSLPPQTCQSPHRASTRSRPM